MLSILASDDTVTSAAIDAIVKAIDGEGEASAALGPLLTISEAARRLGVSRGWFYKRLEQEAHLPEKQKTFRTVPIASDGFRIPQPDVNAFLARTAPFVPKMRAARKPRS